MKTLLAKAEKGYTNAQYEIGLMSLEDDPAAAEQWLSRAASKKHDGATELLAYLRSSGSIQTPLHTQPADRERIKRYMEWLSEECWCAGWYDGIEFALWDALEGAIIQVRSEDDHAA